jgi:hypothetical protein
MGRVSAGQPLRAPAAVKSVLLAVGCLGAGTAWAQDCPDVAVPDCDDDGFTTEEGDCDDDAPDVHPEAQDVCGDDVDQDCSGAPDDDAVCESEIVGGSGCGAAGGWALLPVPWLLVGRRRR